MVSAEDTEIERGEILRDLRRGVEGGLRIR